MEIEFDPAKDSLNIAKHGVTLGAATELEIYAVVRDDRHNYDEDRFNAFGMLRGQPYCLTFAVRRGRIRAISLRRARSKEFKRYVP